ncbi:MAG: c-type cytochrome [Asticcacaulis sp.]
MSDDLGLNKILGACLVTGLVVMTVRIGSDSIYGFKPAAKPGYAIEVADTGGEGAAAAVVDTPPDWGTVLPAADVAAGGKTFVKCQACHNNQEGGPNMTGPNLWGVVGRPTASHPGMSYSDGMMAHAKESPNWTYDQLYMFLANPQKWVKGTKMTFAGVKKPEERINLIAYLRSQGSSGYPIPAPDPSRAPGAAAAAAPAGKAPASGAAPATPGASVSASTAASAMTAPAAKTPALNAKVATSAAAGLAPKTGA